MKAAILKEIGTVPVCIDFPEPVVENNEQVLVDVKASSIKQLDLLKAAGKHYTKYPSLPVIVGMDGVATLGNGQRIYAMGITGMMAQKAIVKKTAGQSYLTGLTILQQIGLETKPREFLHIQNAKAFSISFKPVGQNIF